MSTIIKTAFIAGVLLFSLSSSLLAESKTSHIIELELNRSYGNFAFIKTDNHRFGKASCSTHEYWDYTLPLITEFDKATYVTLLTALVESKEVIVLGDGSHCYEFGSVESLKSVRLKNK